MAVVVSSPDVDEIIPIKRVARSLGISVQTLINMTVRGDFAPRFPLGLRKWLYRRSDLDAFWRTRLGGQNGSRFPLVAAESGDH